VQRFGLKGRLQISPLARPIKSLDARRGAALWWRL
jgi:hypothetical protein